MQRSSIWVAGIAVVILVIATVVLYATRKPSFKGVVLNPPTPAPEISLTDQSGQPFTLSSQRGKVVLLYFGYTNCPDECPSTMAHIKLAVGSLGELSKKIQVLMVTTDPARDDSQALGDFLGKFDPTFLGLLGSDSELQKTYKDYGVVVEDGGETHSYFIYVIDPAGNLRLTFTPDSQPADIASDVRLLLNGD